MRVVLLRGMSETMELMSLREVKHFHPYLYGHRCDVYTDNEALKSPLNTPQPSGRLAHWGWLFKSWICTFTIGQEARTRMQIPCDMTLLLFCSRVQLSPMLAK